MSLAKPKAEYITVRQMCSDYGLNYGTVYKAIRGGRLPYVATGERFGYRIRREDAEGFMEVGRRERVA